MCVHVVKAGSGLRYCPQSLSTSVLRQGLVCVCVVCVSPPEYTHVHVCIQESTLACCHLCVHMFTCVHICEYVELSPGPRAVQYCLLTCSSQHIKAVYRVILPCDPDISDTHGIENTGYMHLGLYINHVFT